MLSPEDAFQKRFSWFFYWIPEVQKRVNRVDLVKSFQMSIYYLLANIGFDTAENEPSKVSSFIPTQAIKFHLCIPLPTLAVEGGKLTNRYVENQGRKIMGKRVCHCRLRRRSRPSASLAGGRCPPRGRCARRSIFKAQSGGSLSCLRDASITADKKKNGVISFLF